MIKRITIFVMTILLIFSNTNFSAAMENVFKDPCSYDYAKINDMHVFVYNRDQTNAVILYNDENNSMSGSISFVRGSVYEFRVIDYRNSYKLASDDYWLDIVSFMENNLDSAEFIQGMIEEFDEIDITGAKSSITADLLVELRNKTGNEYSDRLVDSTTYSGYSVKIKESMVHRITKKRTFSWKTSLTIASYCASFLSLINPSSTVIGIIAEVFGITDLATSIIPAGKSNEYRCRAIYTKVTYVSRNLYACNTTSKYRDYFGIDDGDLTSANRAKIYSQNATYSYSDSSSYYNSNSQQYSDAYDYFNSYYR